MGGIQKAEKNERESSGFPACLLSVKCGGQGNTLYEAANTQSVHSRFVEQVHAITSKMRTRLMIHPPLASTESGHIRLVALGIAGGVWRKTNYTL